MYRRIVPAEFHNLPRVRDWFLFYFGIPFLILFAIILATGFVLWWYASSLACWLVSKVAAMPLVFRAEGGPALSTAQQALAKAIQAGNVPAVRAWRAVSSGDLGFAGEVEMPVTEVINENSAVLPLGGQLRLLRGVATAGLESGESIELDIGTVVFVEKETFSYQMLDGKKVELSVVQVVDVAPLAEFEGLKSRLREWKRFGRAFFVKAVGNSVHVITARGKYGATIDTSAEDKEWVRAFVGPRGK